MMQPIQPIPSPVSEPETEIADNTKSPQANKPEAKPREESDRYTYLLRITIGNLQFENLKGDFLGSPVISLRTRQFSQIEFLLNDEGGQRKNDEQAAPSTQQIAPAQTSAEAGQNTVPDAAPASDPATASTPATPGLSTPDLSTAKPAPASSADGDSLWMQIKSNEGSEVKVELGYPPAVETVLEGKAYRIGRKLPDGVILEIVDSSAQLAQGTGSSVKSAEETLPPTLATLAKPAKPGSEETSASPALTAQAEAAGAAVSSSASPATPIAGKAATDKGLKFEQQSQHKSGDVGTVQMSQSDLQAASAQAAKSGDVIVAEGDTIKQVGAGQGTPSGITLSWKDDRACFIRPPTVTKKTPLQLQGYGAISVSDWSVNDKTGVGATVVTASPIGVHPTGVINVPDWADIKLSDAIVPGSPYTWADATRNGERVPESKAVVEGIIRIAQVLTDLTKKYGESKFEVTSWYRDPATNMAVSSSGAAGPHTTGNAVDFWFPGIVKLFEEMEPSWNGGLAAHPGIYSGAGFVHIDLGARGRWNY